ncbi:MAG: hypothetical protein PVJ84_07835 [Desulfobacteraceae bacterium]|jgi:hypothetical protein
MKNKEGLIIASTLVDTDSEAGIIIRKAEWELKQFYDMEKQIACQIIETLGRDLSD